MTPVYRPVADAFLVGFKIALYLLLAGSATWLIKRNLPNKWMLTLGSTIWLIGMISLWLAAWSLPGVIDQVVTGGTYYCSG